MAGRHDPAFVNGTEAPVRNSDKDFQRCCANREHVFQGKELLDQCKVCEKSNSKCRCRHCKRDESQELVRAAKSVVQRIGNGGEPRQCGSKQRKSHHMNNGGNNSRRGMRLEWGHGHVWLSERDEIERRSRYLCNT